MPDVGDLQRVSHPLIHPHQRQQVAFLLAGNVRSQQGADARRIYVWNIGQIDDHSGRLLRPDHILEPEEIGQGKRPCQAQNLASITRSCNAFHTKRVVWHGRIVIGGMTLFVKEMLISAWQGHPNAQESSLLQKK